MPTYARADVVFERGEGAYLVDTDGRKYLDFASGVAVTALGHAHPHLVTALTEQVQKLWHTSNLFRVAGQEKLAARLIERTFADTVFFCNSGAEAWECGLKLIRKYAHDTGQPERTRIITCGGAFHGRTLASISAANQEKLVKGFEPLLEGFDQVSFGNLNELRAAITPQTMAICVEPLQGEGGIRFAGWDYLTAVRAVCDEFGLLLFLDEIQTGMGRTGKLFAHEWAGITPDVMCVAKGIGGGFPVGACLATEKAAVGMTAGAHGSTYGGNPLAMAAANAVLDIMLAPGFLDSVDRIGQLLQRGLAQLVDRQPAIYPERRGVGLMQGLRCGPPNTEVLAALRRHGLLAVGAGDNVVRLLPPLVIGDDHVDEALTILERVAVELAPEAPE
ncbi:MAG: acetylornithine/succinylornithine family transaminase [Azospirillum sp.]|nr:acetylornithine/succinylornithine family transaminase [Azospirillum sp.]